ncbi:MAG: TetR/AcrR family transcriptional regulator [Acidobacteriota bacterium]
MHRHGSAMAPARRTQEERRSESRRRLLESAAALIADKGWNATTVAEIAQRAGYSPALVGQRFGSKLGVVEALIEHHEQGARTLVDTVEQARSPAEAFDACLLWVEQAVLDAGDWNRAVVVLLAESLGPLRSQQAIFCTSHRETLALIERATGTAESAGVAPPQLAQLLLARLRGLQLLSLLDRQIDLAGALERLRHDFVRLLVTEQLPIERAPWLARATEAPPRARRSRDESRPGQRTQAERRRISTSKILEATAELLAERGVTGTTIESIARRAGYSPGLISQRFGKDELIDLGIEQLLALRTQLFDRALEVASPAQGLDELLRLHAGTQLGANPTQRLLLVLMGEALGALRSKRALFRDLNRSFSETLEGLLRRGVEAGDFRDDLDVEAEALAILSTVRGLSILSLLDDAIDLAESTDALRRTIATRLRR